MSVCLMVAGAAPLQGDSRARGIESVGATQLVAGDGGSGDHFGYPVALDGDTALIGAHFDDTAAGRDAGSAYVFVRSGNTWTQQAKLIASDGQPGDEFGFAVAVDKDTALVGAYFASVSGTSSAGAVYAFVRSGTTWTEQAKLTASDPYPFSYFGNAVSLSGETALVGAYFHDTSGGFDAGAAYVFVRSGDTWSDQAKLTAPDGEGLDHFGSSLSVSGHTALVGSSDDDTGAGFDAGSAYAFVRSGTTWALQAKLLAPDAGPLDYFGRAVALDTDTALVGAPQHGLPVPNAGAAYVFVRSRERWAPQARLIAPDAAEDDYFGGSVALSGATAVIGALDDDTSGGVDSGSAYLFRRSGSTWEPLGKHKAPDAAPEDNFGASVALDGPSAAVGAERDDLSSGSNAGSAWVFMRG